MIALRSTLFSRDKTSCDDNYLKQVDHRSRRRSPGVPFHVLVLVEINGGKNNTEMFGNPGIVEKIIFIMDRFL